MFGIFGFLCDGVFIYVKSTPSAVMARKKQHGVCDATAFVKNGRLSRLHWKEGNVEYEVHLVSDGALLRMGASYFHFKNTPSADSPRERYAQWASRAKEGRLSSFKWIGGTVEHEMDIVYDGAVLNAGGVYYHFHLPPVQNSAIIYKATDGQEYLGVSLDASRGGMVDDKVDAVVLTGQGTVHIGADAVSVGDGVIVIDGKTYRPGDAVRVAGRDAIMSIAAELKE